jgi:hypothetical protein
VEKPEGQCPLFYAPAAERSLAGSASVRLVLFQRDECQLCDLALGLLAQVRAPDFESVFIDGDDALEVRYGERVPVLLDEDGGRELGWPFDADTLRAWLPLP